MAGFKGLGWLALKPGLWWGWKGIAFPPAGAPECAKIRTNGFLEFVRWIAG